MTTERRLSKDFRRKGTFQIRFLYLQVNLISYFLIFFFLITLNLDKKIQDKCSLSLLVKKKRVKIIGINEFHHVKPKSPKKRSKFREDLNASFEEFMTHNHVSALKHFNDSLGAYVGESSLNQDLNGKLLAFHKYFISFKKHY